MNLNEILLNLPSHMAKSSFVTYTVVLNIPLPSRLYTILYITNLILHSHLFTFTFSIPITLSDTKNYLPSDDPNITNLMVSHYDCAKQHNMGQFKLLKAFKCVAYAKKKERFVSKVQLNIVVSIEPYGTTIHYHFLLRLIL